MPEFNNKTYKFDDLKTIFMPVALKDMHQTKTGKNSNIISGAYLPRTLLSEISV